MYVARPSPTEQVRHPLDALAGEVQGTGDLGDGHRRVVRGGEDLPAGARLAGGTGHLVAGGGEEPVESKHLDHEAAEGVAGGGSRDRLSRRSRRGFYIDRMLSLWYAGGHDSILSPPLRTGNPGTGLR